MAARRRFLAAVAACAAGVAAAASLSGLTSRSLGTSTTPVTSCETSGIVTGYTSTYHPASGAYRVTRITIDDIDPACAGKQLRVTAANASGGSLSAVNTTVTVPTTYANVAANAEAFSRIAVAIVDTTMAATVPSGIVRVAGSGNATVSWNPVPSPLLTTYTVTSTPGGFTCVTTGSSCTVTGLANGTAYRFRVVASNTAGTSAPSALTGTATPNATLTRLAIAAQCTPVTRFPGFRRVRLHNPLAVPVAFTLTNVPTAATVPGIAAPGYSYWFVPATGSTSFTVRVTAATTPATNATTASGVTVC